MTGQGSIFGVYFGQQPHFDLVDRLNLSPEDHSIIRVSSCGILEEGRGCVAVCHRERE